MMLAFVCGLHSNKGMDHLCSMKRKKVVLVYDLLLEMLDSDTSDGRPPPGHAPPPPRPQTPAGAEPPTDG